MGLTAPEINYLFQEMLKDTPLVVPALIFEVKIPPSPPLEQPIGPLFGKFLMKKTRETMGISKLVVKMF